MHRKPRRIVLGVTHAGSLKLMTGLPGKLAEEGWEVHIVSAEGPQTVLLDDSAVKVHRIPMERQPALAKDIRALRIWIKLLKRLRPDVVFVGTPKAGLLGIVAARYSRIPNRIYHLRGLRLETERGARYLTYWLFEKISFSLSTSVISVSKSLRKKAIQSRLVRANKIQVLGAGSSNGIDTFRFHPDNKRPRLSIEDQIRSDVPVIGFVGRITKDKGSHELSAASQILQRRGVDHQLLIVGPEEDREVRRCRGRDGSQHAPIFTGAVTDTAPYYHLMDLLCLPTYREGFPNVILEAGASGLASVTTEATGAVDSVLDYVTGRVVPVGDADELAEVLECLIVYPEKRRRYGNLARKHVEKNFSRDEIQKKIAAYLDSLQR